MDVGTLQQTYTEMFSALLSEGIVNQQFKLLYRLQDEDDPRFTFQTVSLFFVNAEKLINDIGSKMNQQVVDYANIKELVHQLKGSNRSIGAQRIEDACLAFCNYCNANDLQGQSVVQLSQQHLTAQSRVSELEAQARDLFMVEHQILAAGGSIPKMP